MSGNPGPEERGRAARRFALWWVATWAVASLLSRALHGPAHPLALVIIAVLSLPVALSMIAPDE